MPIKIPNAQKSEDRYTQYVSLTLVAILGMFYCCMVLTMNSNCLSRDGKILVSGIYGACPTKEHECDDIFLALISTTYFFSPPPHLN